MKRPRSKKQNDFEFVARFGENSIRFRLQKPSKAASARLLRWALVILLALLILLTPQLWQAIQTAISIVSR
jgi:hypothetical protein